MASSITTAASRALARSVPRCSASAPVRALSSTAAVAHASATYDSPFKGQSKADKIPDFSHYMSKANPTTNLLFQYFMVGTMGAITAAGAKSTIQGELGRIASVDQEGGRFARIERRSIGKE